MCAKISRLQSKMCVEISRVTRSKKNNNLPLNNLIGGN